jgi:hypothetical protein
MEVTIRVPDDLAELLGPEPSRALLEAALLQWVREERMSVAYAGQVLGLSPMAAIEWYTGHGYDYPALTEDEAEAEIKSAFRRE